MHKGPESGLWETMLTQMKGHILFAKVYLWESMQNQGWHFKKKIRLTITTLLADSTDDKLFIFFLLFFPENRIWHFMQDRKIRKKYFNMSSAENLTQSAKS